MVRSTLLIPILCCKRELHLTTLFLKLGSFLSRREFSLSLVFLDIFFFFLISILKGTGMPDLISPIRSQLLISGLDFASRKSCQNYLLTFLSSCDFLLWIHFLSLIYI